MNAWLNRRRVGGAKVLLAGVVLWSIGTLAAPPLAHISLLALCASRVFVSQLQPPLYAQLLAAVRLLPEPLHLVLFERLQDGAPMEAA